MRANKPTGKQKRSVPKKVDWKALEIVHPDAAGIDVGGRSIGWPSARSATWFPVSDRRSLGGNVSGGRNRRP
jgi:hypothetical protein